MQHNSPAFSGAALEEWLIYFEWSYKTFSLVIIGDGGPYKVTGRRSYSRNVAISLQMDVLGKSVALALKTSDDIPWSRRLPSGEPYFGTILTDGQNSGSCFVEDSHKEDKPVIRVEMKSYRIEAYRAVPGFVVCPMLVFGIENCEMVLERYEMLDRRRKRALPDNGLKRQFVGSCRSIRYSEDIINRRLEGISIVVAVSELIVKDLFMSPA